MSDRGLRQRHVPIAVLLAGALALSLTGCRTEYRGPDPDIDGVLWRQVASVEDPVMLALSRSLTPDPDTFLDELPAQIWRDRSDPPPDLRKPVAVVYDLDRGVGALTFSVFFSSGRRADLPTDSGASYAGPDSVFTCSRWTVRFGEYAVASTEREDLGAEWEDCPAALIEAMPGDVAFAEPGVFAG